MKALQVFRLFSLWLIITFGCEKEDDIDKSINYQANAKLKRVLLYASASAREPISVIGEYEYNAQDKVNKVSSPLYENGVVTGTSKYDLYEYNPKGQLIKIANFNANLNSPTGFINLKNHIYSYSQNGLKEKEYIEYPQINTHEYSLFKYANDKLIKLEKYNYRDELETFTLYEYNQSGELIKEIAKNANDEVFSVTLHTYAKGLNTKSEVFSGNQEHKIREILKTYDSNKNLITTESKELSQTSSAMSYVLRYEYY